MKLKCNQFVTTELSSLGKALKKTDEKTVKTAKDTDMSINLFRQTLISTENNLNNMSKTLFNAMKNELDSQLMHQDDKINKVMMINNTKNVEIEDNIGILEREKEKLNKFIDDFLLKSNKEQSKLEEVADRFTSKYKELENKIEFIEQKLKETYDFSRDVRYKRNLEDVEQKMANRKADSVDFRSKKNISGEVTRVKKLQLASFKDTIEKENLLDSDVEQSPYLVIKPKKSRSIKSDTIEVQDEQAKVYIAGMPNVVERTVEFSEGELSERKRSKDSAASDSKATYKKTLKPIKQVDLESDLRNTRSKFKTQKIEIEVRKKQAISVTARVVSREKRPLEKKENSGEQAASVGKIERDANRKRSTFVRNIVGMEEDMVEESSAGVKMKYNVINGDALADLEGKVRRKVNKVDMTEFNKMSYSTGFAVGKVERRTKKFNTSKEALELKPATVNPLKVNYERKINNP